MLTIETSQGANRNMFSIHILVLLFAIPLIGFGLLYIFQVVRTEGKNRLARLSGGRSV
jgi:hypothetical protein